MKHRHLDIPDDEYSVAAIHSIFERGRSSDIVKLFQAIRDDPFSHIAENALTAAGDSEVYGYPRLMTAAVEKWRAEHEPKHGL
jgi:hypothetical protein